METPAGITTVVIPEVSSVTAVRFDELKLRVVVAVLTQLVLLTLYLVMVLHLAQLVLLQQQLHMD